MGTFEVLKYREKISQQEVKHAFIILCVMTILLCLTGNKNNNDYVVEVSDAIINNDHYFNYYTDLNYEIDDVTELNYRHHFRNYDNATMKEKLIRWNHEYNYRVRNDNKPVRSAMLNLLKKYSKKGSVFIDSGAHIGDTSIPVLKSLWDEGRRDLHLLLIEPDPSKCLWIKIYTNWLNENGYEGISNYVHIVNSGLWSHSSHATMMRGNHPGSWDIVVDEYRYRDYVKTPKRLRKPFKQGDIKVMSLSEILNPNRDVALLHLDVERCEKRALLGLLRTKHRPIIIYESMKKNNPDFLFERDFLHYLFGYKMINRLKPNMDRIMIPPNNPDYHKYERLPPYI